MPKHSPWILLLALLAIVSFGIGAGCSAAEPEGDETPGAPTDTESTDPGDDPAATDPDAQGSLPLGDMTEDDLKADGNWGAATTCKAIPSVPVLSDPKITVSLNAQTLHLVDRAGGYDRVFPIGVGAINEKPTESTYLESRSYYPIIATGGNDFTIKPASTNTCAIWWTDPDSGQRLPVFAGLPFMSWYGSYGIHGPITDYTAANGGRLQRGFVSHGCIRMEAADVLEVYGRIRTLARVTVHVQREPERDASGRRIEIPQPWIGSECQADADCSFSGGFCKQNRYSGRGFCSVRCTRTCTDRWGYPTTFCVTDPDNTTLGMCVSKAVSQNYKCRPYDHLVPKSQSRFNQSSTKATVCMPGSPGWVGDRCFASSDCQTGNRCVGASTSVAGICTQSCTRSCPDLPGWPWTFCVNESSLGGPTCLRECTPASNASECPAGFTCQLRSRNGDASRQQNVCIPG